MIDVAFFPSIVYTYERQSGQMAKWPGTSVAARILVGLAVISSVMGFSSERARADFNVATGTFGQIWTGYAVPTSNLDAAMPPAVTAVFQWNNSIQQFNFWFRGFPSTFNTLSAGLQPAGYYFFQASSFATVSEPGASPIQWPLPYPPPGNMFYTVAGANGVVWTGTSHSLPSLELILQTSHRPATTTWVP